MALETFNPELVYTLKGNIAYPVVGAASLATTAQNRLKDAFTDSNAAQTQRISAVTIAAQTNVNN